MHRALVVLSAVLSFLAPCAAAGGGEQASLREEKVLRHPALHIPTRLVPASELPGIVATQTRQDVTALGLDSRAVFYDDRFGRLTSFVLSAPLIPGTGAGNELRWPAGVSPRDHEAVRDIAWTALREWLRARNASLRIDAGELGEPRVGVLEDAGIVQIYAPRVLGGIPVRDSGLTAVLNHGNLVLLGLDRWGDGAVAGGGTRVAEAVARLVVARHLAPYEVESMHAGRLEYIPMAKGAGYENRLAWTVRVNVAGDAGTWEALVDASSGELLAFEDRNEYARKVVGGVYPVSNDQRAPDGIEQPAWPMPFADVGSATANAHGVVSCGVAGTQSTTLSGPFVGITDSCGAIAESAPGDIDLGAGGGTDCAVPAGHSAGDTHAARTAFHELNRIKEQARGYLPANAWLQSALPVTTNINQSCNAFWNGTSVGFFRDNGSPCRNTGEIAGIIGHEFGHGMDNNGINPSVSRPGGGIADVHAWLRVQDSCMGRGFWKNQVCGGYGDPCDPPVATGCTGARQLDFMGSTCDRPHTVTWITQGFTAAECNGVARPACPGMLTTAPCGRGDHCEGMVVAETAYDLARRDLPAAGYDSNTAQEIATRLFTVGAGVVSDWYTCSVGGGCGAAGGYLQVLAVDDDNGNLADGTPHMTAIRAAFERHEIHCAFPPVADSGCAGGPAGAPALIATAGLEQIALSWSPVPSTAAYSVYRADGVFGCGSGKVKIAEVTGTSFTDGDLLAGRGYSYVVLPVGTNASCLGRASNCASATPAAAAPCTAAPDFTLSCLPSSLTVNQGTSGQSACSVRSLGGFSAAVDMSCSALPAGATCSFAPPVVIPSPDSSAPSTPYRSGRRRQSRRLHAPGRRDERRPHAHVRDRARGHGAVARAGGARPGSGRRRRPPARRDRHHGAHVAQRLRLRGGARRHDVRVHRAAGRHVHEPRFRRDLRQHQRRWPGHVPGLLHGERQRSHAAGHALGCPDRREGDSGRDHEDLDAARRGQLRRRPARQRLLPFRRDDPSPQRDRRVHGERLLPSRVHHPRAAGGLRPCRKEAPGYAPPPCGATPMFSDVPVSSPFCPWIEELANRGVVAGCAPAAYCPAAPATRDQMAVFVLRTLDPAVDPPACVPPNAYDDVPETSPFCRWIEELTARGVVTGCGGGNYCPGAEVTREQMSVFLAVSFGLPLYGP